ncbi:hypothetical protein BJ170DRAFT_684181 [Xylariales sp. AK1849]|nr:hypothetical protein BJ170DRAFT_684181 [Xylariales sp. AK1849]
MATLAQLEGHSDQLLAAVKRLANLDSSSEFCIQDPDADKEIKQATANILAKAEAIKTLVRGPTDFLQHLASQVEVLSCLHWLAEFQILACIPLDLNLSIKDLAELTGVPQKQLHRVICMTATAGFLRVIESDLVAHTPLSAQFIANQSLLDAAMFMAETAAPTALLMSAATQRFGDSLDPSETAYNLALKTSGTFNIACQSLKLARQWSAYLRHAAGLHQEEEVVGVLSRLNWSNLGDACIVEVGAHSTSTAQFLAKQYPNLRLVVQITASPDASLSNRIQNSDVQLDTNPSSNASSSSTHPLIKVTFCAEGTAPTVTDAAAYIVHLPPSSPGETDWGSIRSLLQVYLGVLRVSGAIMIIPTIRLLSEPSSFLDPEAEAVARTRDLSMLQLANEGEMRLAELLQIIGTVGDSVGKLVIANELNSHNGVLLVLIVKYINH